MSNRILAELQDDGAGRLRSRGGRFLLIRPETLVALQRAMETALGAAAAECLAAGGRAGGGRATAALDGGPRERAEALLAMGTQIGWGHFALERLTPAELVVTVRHSPFAERPSGAGAPVCHLTRGVLDSLAALVLERPAAVVETACAAAGAPECRFETVARRAEPPVPEPASPPPVP